MIEPRPTGSLLTMRNGTQIMTLSDPLTLLLSIDAKWRQSIGVNNPPPIK